jgi:hypothetical protein
MIKNQKFNDPVYATIYKIKADFNIKAFSKMYP